MRRVLVFLLLAGAISSPAQQATSIRDGIATIAGGADTAARRGAITEHLKASGIEFRLEEFTFQTFSGTNIVVDIPGKNSGKQILLGAHYDRVAQGQGVVDNGASCAVLLQLLTDLKSKPLQNYSVRVVFFDVEERGLLGSQAYFAKSGDGDKPALAINLDVFGYGDTFFVFASAPDGPLATAFQQAAKQFAMPVRLVTVRNQYPASDHRTMMAAGIETMGLAIIDAAEIDAILGGAKSAPRILTIIHTAEDNIDKVRTADIEKALPVLAGTLRLIDAR